MGIFNEFYKKEKPFFTGIARGFGFGGASGGGGGAALHQKYGGLLLVEVNILTGGNKIHTFTSSGSLTVTTGSGEHYTPSS